MKRKLLLVPVVAISLAGCTHVQGLMDPSINVSSKFTSYYYLDHFEMDGEGKTLIEKTLNPITSTNPEGYFNGSNGSDGSKDFYPMVDSRQGTPLSKSERSVHHGLVSAGYSDMLEYEGETLSTSPGRNWLIYYEGRDVSNWIGSDFGKTKCLATVDEAFSTGYLSKLYNGQMYCMSTHSLAFVSIDEDGFSTRLPKTLVDADYFLVAFRGGSDDRSHNGDTTARLVTIDLRIDFYFEDRVISTVLDDCYVNTDNGGEAVSFTGFKLGEDTPFGESLEGLIGYGISYSNYYDEYLEVGSGEGKISPNARVESEAHFGLLLYEVMFVDSTWR